MKTFLPILLIFTGKLYCQTDSTNFFQNPVPSISMTAPDVLGKGYFGTIGIGGNGQSTTRLTDRRWGPDGSGIFTIGLGDPEKYLGVDLRINIYGLSNKEGEPGNLGEGTVDWHINRMISKRFWAGVGGYDLLGWYNGDLNKLHSVYACATTYFTLRKNNLKPFSTIFLNGGVGNGRFRPDKDFTLSKTNPFGVFGSAAIQVLPTTNLVAEWSGYGLYTGISVVPVKKWPLQLIFGADDLLNKQWRWVLAGSVGYRFKKKKPGERFRPYFLPVGPPPQTSRV